MILDQVFYRARQFRQAMSSSPDQKELEKVGEVLTPAQTQLFMKLQPSEQAHALRVFDRLTEQGVTHPDLLAAALLHDVGKARYPLKPWERAAAELAKKFFPGRVGKWGQGEPRGLKAGVVVAEQHAQWGAEMAETAGASDLAVRLIACHQDQAPTQLSEPEMVLLSALQSVDEVS